MGAVRVTSAAEAASIDAAAIAGGIAGFTLMAAAGTRAVERLCALACDTRLARGVHVFVGAGNNGGDGWIVAAQLVRLGVRVHVHVAGPPRTTDSQRAAAIARQLLPSHAVSPVDGHVHERTFGRVPGRDGPPGVVVDALLGTGATGPLRGAIADAAATIARARAAGALVLALDVPSGVDATTGAAVDGHVVADATVTFGTLKQGLLAARSACGRLWVVDIGLEARVRDVPTGDALPVDAPAEGTRDDEIGAVVGPAVGRAAAGGPAVGGPTVGGAAVGALAEGAPAALLAEPQLLRTWRPRVPWDAHKGVRGRLLVVGGARGMAGAVQFVAQGALHSGVGLVHAAVDDASVAAVQAGAPAVVCVPVGTPIERAIDWAHAVVLGPGLGRSDAARRLVEQVLTHVGAATDWRADATARAHGSQATAFSAREAPALLVDADAVRLLADADGVAALRTGAASAPVVLTPHAAECAALAEACGVPFVASARDVAARLAAARAIAAACGAHLLLKGAPTLCVAPDGTAWFVPRGGPTLATGGTGDVLAGVLGAVLASARAVGRLSPREPVGYAALAAWVHGVAGEHVAATQGVRGGTVMDVAHALGAAWAALDDEQRQPVAPGVLAELPVVRT